MNAEQISKKMRACTLCTDLPLGPKPLFRLHKDARILIAGQAPGRKTHEKGIPFDDASGDRLRSWMGIDRDVFYESPKLAILPMGLCYPGTTKSGDLPPRPECAVAWRNDALSTLGNLDLCLIIGRYAMDWHLEGFKGKTIAEVSLHHAELNQRNLVLPHPSPRNNRWLRQNTWFEERLVPLLRRRVAELLEPVS